MEATKRTEREQIREMVREVFAGVSEATQKKMEDAMVELLDAEIPQVPTEEIKKEIVQGLFAKSGDKMTKETKDLLEGVFVKILEGELPKNALEFSDSIVEHAYAYAYNLYVTGNYDSARHMFTYLQFLDRKDPRFPMGLAACFSKTKDYVNAIRALTQATCLDMKSPIPYYHISDCFTQLGNPEMAVAYLIMTIKLAKKNPVYQPIEQRAEMMLQGIMDANPGLGKV